MTAKPTPVDPVQAAFDNAPIGEPETDEERRMDRWIAAWPGACNQGGDVQGIP